MVSDISVIVVQNSFDHLFVHQRKDDKRVYPLLYGLGAGGKVDKGETPRVAAIRELSEELRLDVSELEDLFSFEFDGFSGLSYNVNVFRTYCNGEIVPCEREFQWSGWMEISGIDNLMHEGKLCPDTKVLYEKFKRDFYK